MDTTKDDATTCCPHCGSRDLSAWHPAPARGVSGWYCLCCQHQWGVAPPISATTERVLLRFDRLTDGTLVAVHQGVAAIVHPARSLLPPGIRWTLAGDGFRSWPTLDGGEGGNRPHGEQPSVSQACAQAAEALGVHLGVTVDGYEIAL